MATKLKEFLAQNNLTLDDLEDEELGMSVAEVRKRFKVNGDNYTTSQQALKDRERQLQEYTTAYEGWKSRAEQLEQQSQALERQIAQRAEKVAASGGDWKRDPLFQDLVADFDGITGGIAESREASQALARGMLGIAQRYTADRVNVMTWIDKAEQRFMKQDNPDFDAEQIRTWAKENGVATSWQDSYTRWKASKMPEIIEETKKKTREEVLAEHGDKFRAPVETEMGGSGRPAPPAGGGKDTRTYNERWAGLGPELEKAGLARS